MEPEDLLDQVADRDSFLAFVKALVDNRLEAERMEREDPIAYQLGGALNWQNCDIAAFLEAALQYFKPGLYRQPEDSPSWRMLADFLYFGKIYE